MKRKRKITFPLCYQPGRDIMTSSSLTSSTDPANQKNPVGRREGLSSQPRPLGYAAAHAHLPRGLRKRKRSDAWQVPCPGPRWLRLHCAVGIKEEFADSGCLYYLRRIGQIILLGDAALMCGAPPGIHEWIHSSAKICSSCPSLGARSGLSKYPRNSKSQKNSMADPGTGWRKNRKIPSGRHREFRKVRVQATRHGLTDGNVGQITVLYLVTGPHPHAPIGFA